MKKTGIAAEPRINTPKLRSAVEEKKQLESNQPPPSISTTQQTEGVGAAPSKFQQALKQTTGQMVHKTFVPNQLPPMTIPTAEVSKTMAAGKYDFAALQADVQAKFGVNIEKAPPGAVALFPVATHGVWASEMTLAMEVFKAAGYDVQVATLDGKAPMFLPVSVNEKFVDPTWNAGWVAPGEAELGWKVQQELMQMEKAGKIISLDAAIPARPQAAAGPEAKAKYAEALAQGLAKFENVQQTMMPGGTGAIIDLADNSQLEALLELQHNAGNPIAGVCYGALSLLNADDGAMMKGVSLTIHNRADDFVTGTGALTDAGVAKLRAHVERGDLEGFKNDGAVWTSEWRSPTVKAEVTAEAIGGEGAQVISPYDPGSMAVLDQSKVKEGKGVIATGRSIHCSYDAALAMVASSLGTSPLKGDVLMLHNGEKAKAPQAKDYNQNNTEIWG